jgi:serine/threonine-protein kinase
MNEIILQALEKDPARRFQTADAFRNALLYVCKGGQAAAPSTPIAAPQPVRKAEPVQPPKPPIPSAPAVQAGGSHRGLWIAVGVVLGIAVLAIAAMQIPKFRHTAAETAQVQPPAASQTEAPQSSQSTMPAAATESQPLPTESTVARETQSTPASTPAQVSDAMKPVQPPTAARPASVQMVRSSAGRQSSAALKPTATAAASHGTQPSASVHPAEPPAQAYQAVQSSPSTPSEDPKVAEQLKEVREQLDLLSVRADTVRGSLDALRRQQAASGLGLRADMANSAQRMDMFMSQTQAALKRRDADAAKKNLDSAEREVSRLENFLHK